MWILGGLAFRSRQRIKQAFLVNGTILFRLVVLLVIVLSTCVAQADPMKAVKGIPIVLHMEGNPSTGHSWQLNKQQSRGLEAVRLRALGWKDASSVERSPVVGAPKVFSVEVTPIQAEMVFLVYEYRRSWEDQPAEKQERFEIKITDAER